MLGRVPALGVDGRGVVPTAGRVPALGVDGREGMEGRLADGLLGVVGRLAAGRLTDGLLGVVGRLAAGRLMDGERLMDGLAPPPARPPPPPPPRCATAPSATNARLRAMANKINR